MNNKRMKTLLIAALYGIAIVLLLAAIIEAESSTIIFAATYVFIIVMAIKVVWNINHRSSEKNGCVLSVFDMLSGNSEEDSSKR